MEKRRSLLAILWALRRVSGEVSSSRPFSKMSRKPLDDNPIGGGAINEKKRSFGSPADGAYADDEKDKLADSDFDPILRKSHLFHSIEGLDRYPNYLSRWNENDIDLLEEALQHQLKKVQTQRKEVVQRRLEIKTLIDHILVQNKSYQKLTVQPSSWEEVHTILDASARKAIFRSSWFRQKQPTIQDVINGEALVELDTSHLEGVMDQECFDVYSIRILQESFCREIRDFVRHVHEQGKTDPRFQHLDLGRRPLDLDSVGLGWLNDLLFQLILRPISRHLFTSTETVRDLDWRQGYVAGYAADPDDGRPRSKLVTHTDDSEVTLNLGLGEDFEGGDVEFLGLRGTKRAGQQIIDSIHPRIGYALIHAGRHFHQVTPVTKGSRYALILWARSWQGIRRESCPCCWLNRREKGDCICGRTWN